MFLTHGKRFTNALLKKSLVNRNALRRNPADIDLGFRIVEANSQKTLPMVFDLNNRAVLGRRGHSKNSAVINPRMARDHPIRLASV